jgi:hypothetical protein
MPSTRSGSSGAVTVSDDHQAPPSPSSGPRQAYCGTRMTPAGVLADLRAKKAKGAFWRELFEPVIAPAD